jgi:hypothetical protein
MDLGYLSARIVIEINAYVLAYLIADSDDEKLVDVDTSCPQGSM